MLYQISKIKYQNDNVKFKIVKTFWTLICNFNFCILIFTFLCGCQNKALYRDTQVMMGTFVEVKSTDERAARIAFAEMKRIEELTSKYKEDSEVSRLNKLGELNVSPEVIYLIKKAKEFWLASNGAFDITVGPLMDLWGFTPLETGCRRQPSGASGALSLTGFTDKKYFLPSPADIKRTLETVGFDKVIINEADNSVKFKVPGMKLDLGAIAKGYALDCAVRQLKEKGVTSAIVSVGGEIYGLGTKAGKPWVVAIRSSDKKGFAGTLELVNRAVSTSGNYEQFFIKDGIRYAHIINPKTGMPSNSKVAGVTVLARDCLTADALATAIFVLGEDKGMALAGKFPDAQVKIIKE